MVAHMEVLIAAADLETRRRLANILSQWGFEAVCASTVDKARTILARQGVPMVFCEDRLADGGFRDVLGAAKLVQSNAPVVVASWTDDLDGYMEAIQLGAFDVIPCPCRPADVHRVVSHALRQDGENPRGPAFREADEIKTFYDRWRTSVFKFCCLFLGCQESPARSTGFQPVIPLACQESPAGSAGFPPATELASECTREAFLNYLREKLVLQTSVLPAPLMGSALAAVVRRSGRAAPAQPPSQTLPETLLRIPGDQRAVFILRGVLGMSDLAVAAATGFSVERMRRLWRRSLLTLRAMLPRTFFAAYNVPAATAAC